MAIVCKTLSHSTLLTHGESRERIASWQVTLCLSTVSMLPPLQPILLVIGKNGGKFDASWGKISCYYPYLGSSKSGQGTAHQCLRVLCHDGALHTFNPTPTFLG